MKRLKNLFAIVASFAVMAFVSGCGDSASANNAKVGNDSHQSVPPPSTAAGDTMVKQSSEADDTTMPARRLTIEGCPYPIRIVQGNAFVFPADLEEFGLTYSRKGDGYVLETSDDSSLPKVPVAKIAFGDSGAILTVPGGSQYPLTVKLIQKGGRINTAVFERNGVTATQTDTGTLQAYVTSSGVYREIVIVVPPHTSIGGNATSFVRIETVLDSMSLKTSGNAIVYADSVHVVQSLLTLGSSKATVRGTDTLWNVAAKGTSTVTASIAKIGNRTTSDQGKIVNPGN